MTELVREIVRFLELAELSQFKDRYEYAEKMAEITKEYFRKHPDELRKG